MMIPENQPQVLPIRAMLRMDHRVPVGEGVHGPMLADPGLDTRRQPFDVRPLHEVGNEVADHRFGVVFGQVQVGQEVHG